MTDATTTPTADAEKLFGINEIERVETTLELQALRKGVRPQRITHVGSPAVSIAISTLAGRRAAPDGVGFRVIRHQDELQPLLGDGVQLRMHGMISRINPAAFALGDPVRFDHPPKQKGGFNDDLFDQIRRARLYVIDCTSQAVQGAGLGMQEVSAEHQARLHHHMHATMKKQVENVQDISAGAKRKNAEESEAVEGQDDSDKPMFRVGMSADASGCVVVTNQLVWVGDAVNHLRFGAELACREWAQE